MLALAESSKGFGRRDARPEAVAQANLPSSSRAVFVAVALALGAVESTQAQIACRYEIVAMIQAPPGPNVNSPTYPLGISPNGQYIVGYFNYDAVGMARAWVYTMPNGPFFVLPYPAGYWTSRADAVNDAGKVSGYIGGSSGGHGFVYDIHTGQFDALIPPLNGNGVCQIMDINASGVACGVRAMGPKGMTTAFIWDPVYGTVDLGFIEEQSTGFISIADNGQVAGYRGIFQGANSRGLVGDPQSPEVVGPVPNGTTSTFRDINEDGVACGQGRVPQPTGGYRHHAATWSVRGFQSLSLLPDFQQAFANAITADGIVAGECNWTSSAQSAARGAAWVDGVAVDLTSRLEEPEQHLVQSVSDVASDGTIVAGGLTQLINNPLALVLRPMVSLQGDLNKDCFVNVSDLLAVISTWGTSDPLGDANADGTVNVTDLLIVIQDWRP